MFVYVRFVNKASYQTPAGLLQPLPIATRVWEHITMDFVEGLPKSHGIDTVLVVVDRFTKYAHFLGLKHPFNTKTIAELFAKKIVRLHGFPSSIVSDRDRIFLSSFWKELFCLQGTKLVRSTAFHPQTDGQSEIVNKALETFLRCFINGHPKQWAKWVSWAELCYNTSPYSTINMTPFQTLYGHPPPHLVRFGHSSTALDSLEQLLQERDAMLDEIQFNLVKAQQTIQHYANTKHRELSLNEGDLVFLKLRPYRQKSLAHRQNEKLVPRYYGPYDVLQRMRKVAYKLALPSTSLIHHIFHVSQLKPAQGFDSASDIPPPLSDELVFEATHADIFVVRAPTPTTLEVLVQW